ncbi:zf-HC2 domain-containing protein [Actinomadura spongiicola]|uniref:Zf-HC2 domain-containing protein n=1 Tax=Actinomadura spongiicola TaxID=2303421 RepID=A0A372GB89_9ACTN|nr:zf-HC2 domain-containing protein [Actinomadura spongiicola]RFS82621.1 zf-HC2 domain-containing protein [Actinomadura spongiicola]
MSAAMSHTDVGAYALGLLEEPDRRAFENHLSGCPACDTELAELRGVAATLDGISRIPEPAGGPPAPPEPAVISDLLRRRIRRERRHRAARAMAAAAAGVVLVGGALGTGYTLGADRDRTASQEDAGTAALLRDGHRTSAADATTGATGTVATRRTAWGSRIALELSRVRGPLECELVAVDRAGRPHTVAGWAVPAAGYGLPGSARPRLTLQGGTALRPREISRFEVRTTGEFAGSPRTLLTVPG